jgi:hypothetical protein
MSSKALPVPAQSRPRTEAERGEHDGRALARLGLDIPPLIGGAYAVGFLYGYRSEQRRRRNVERDNLPRSHTGGRSLAAMAH